MKHLIVMRHAQAGEADSDHARPLRPGGQHQALQMGPAIVALGPDFQPARVLCSSARRARETWDGVRPALADTPAVDFRDDLYLAGAGQMLAQLQELPEDIDATLLIAHEPGLSQLTSLLTGSAAPEVQERARRGLSTGAIAALRFDTHDWSNLGGEPGELMDFRRPADP